MKASSLDWWARSGQKQGRPACSSEEGKPEGVTIAHEAVGEQHHDFLDECGASALGWIPCRGTRYEQACVLCGVRENRQPGMVCLLMCCC